MKYNIPPEYKILTAYSHPNPNLDRVVIAESEDKVGFFCFEYEQSIPIEIFYEPRLPMNDQ